MNSTQINCFISLGKTLNFTQTAKELYLAQPTVSKNIHNLESELGVELIKHEQRQIVLTVEGKYFYKELLKITNELNKVIHTIQDSKNNTMQTITIGYSGLPFEKQFLPIFMRLMKKTKKCNIFLKSVSLSEPFIHENLDSKKIDFMIYQSDFFQNKKYKFTPMFEAGFSVIIRRDSPLRKYKKIPLEALKKNRIFLWDGKTPLASVSEVKKAIELSAFPEKCDLVIISKASLASMLVQANDGIAIVPSFVYDHNNTEVYYRYFDWNHTVSYGLGYLKEMQEKPCYQELLKNMQHAINITKKKWQN